MRLLRMKLRNAATLSGMFAAYAFCANAYGGDTGPVTSERDARARGDYILHCSGCHLQDGVGNPAKGIPRFTDQIGYFLRLPEGREFLMQVPGLLSARLSDERAAGVVNYIIRKYAGPSMPETFDPYTAGEAKQLRESRPADIPSKRKALYDRFVQDGLPFQ